MSEEVETKIINEFTEKFRAEYGEVEKLEEEKIYTSPTKIEMLLFPNESPINEGIRGKTDHFIHNGFRFEAKRLFRLLSILDSAGVDLWDVIIETPNETKPLRIRDNKDNFHLILAPLEVQKLSNQSSTNEGE